MLATALNININFQLSACNHIINDHSTIISFYFVHLAGYIYYCTKKKLYFGFL